jgi:DNA-binding GntR family transcriptional regulator
MTMSRRVLLKHQAYEKIKEKILKGDYIDNNYITENQLVEELEMSRTPIREALQRLQHEKFLTITSNQGIVIKELSIKDTNDMLDLRLAIELFSLRNSVHLLSMEHLHYLEDLVRKQEVTHQQGNAFLFTELDAEFHQYLLKISDNELFDQMMLNIRERLFCHGTRIFKRNPVRMLQSINEHIGIIEGLKSGQFESAITQMEQHIINGKMRLMS